MGSNFVNLSILPSCILRKIKNAYTSLLLRSSSVSLPNFVKIRWSCMPSRNMICGVKFCQFFTLDRRWTSWIKNLALLVRLSSICMSMPNFVKIVWKGAVFWAEMWFVGCSLVNLLTLTGRCHEFWEKTKRLH